MATLINIKNTALPLKILTNTSTAVCVFLIKLTLNKNPCFVPALDGSTFINEDIVKLDNY